MLAKFSDFHANLNHFSVLSLFCEGLKLRFAGNFFLDACES